MSILTPRQGIYPAGSITNLVLISTTGSRLPASLPNTTGPFTLHNLPIGNYTVPFEPASGYTAPANRNIVISLNTTLNLGTITVTPLQPFGFYVDGTAISVTQKSAFWPRTTCRSRSVTAPPASISSSIT